MTFAIDATGELQLTSSDSCVVPFEVNGSTASVLPGFVCPNMTDGLITWQTFTFSTLDGLHATIDEHRTQQVGPDTLVATWQGDLTKCVGDAGCGPGSGTDAGACTSPSGLLVGDVCGSAEAGIPACGGGCATRSCNATGAPPGELICQPSTGCHVLGESCATDADCCGSVGMPYAPSVPVTCVVTAGCGGICTQTANVCIGNGGICKDPSTSCNESWNCCSGDSQTTDTCRADNQGVFRCTNVQCVGAGSACASSADCCNAAPCVPNASGNPPRVCFSAACVPPGGPCSATADCCTGANCTAGTCQ